MAYLMHEIRQIVGDPEHTDKLSAIARIVHSDDAKLSKEPWGKWEKDYWSGLKSKQSES